MATVRILPVEDDRTVARDLQSRLQRLGYDAPSVASSKAEAVHLVEHQRPALVLMDIQLKGQREGIDAAREIRDRFDVPVVYLTAHADPETLKQASLTRPFAYLLKPVDDRELAAAIEAALANHAAEKRLRETERWLSATLRSIDDGVLTADRNLRVRFLNRVAEELTGWKVAEAVGQNVLDVFQLDREGTPIAARDLVAEAREDGPIVGRRKAARLVAKDGRQTFITHSVSPILDDRSQSTGFVLVFRDVTEHEDAEREIRAQGEALDTANRQLRQQVERLQLAEQQLIQAQKMEALGRLAGGVAHDFNNLLTVIAGYNSMMLEEQLSPDGAEGAREIAGAVERAAALTKQLLAFGRHKMRSPAPLDLNEVVCQIEKMLRRIVGDNVRLVTKLAPGIAKVYVDAGQIDQVILNLAVNARDAMPDGGALTIETAEVEFGGESTDMRIGAPPGQYVMLAITDTGTGMGVEVQKRMFEPFFTTKEAGKGTGLGLSIVHGIVSQSGGEISVLSVPGNGTIFRVFLPVVRDSEIAPPKTVGEPCAAATGTETILLAEDEEAVRRLVSSTLRRQGYQVIEAATPGDAVRLTAGCAGQIDLLLTDVVMPLVNGVELARILRISKPGLKTLYMSGYAESAASEVEIGESASAQITKPFTAAALTRKVREVLGGGGDTRSSTSEHHG